MTLKQVVLSAWATAAVLSSIAMASPVSQADGNAPAVPSSDPNQSPGQDRGDDRALGGTWVGQIRRGDRTVRVVLFVKSDGAVSGVLGRYEAPSGAVLETGNHRELRLSLDQQTQFTSKSMTLKQLLAVRAGKVSVALQRRSQSSETRKTLFELTRRYRSCCQLALIPEQYDIADLTVKGTADQPFIWLAVCQDLGADRSALQEGVDITLAVRRKIAELNRKLGPQRRSMGVYMQYLRALESIRTAYLSELAEILPKPAATGLDEAVHAVSTFEDDAAVLIAARKATEDPARRKAADKRYRDFVKKRTEAVRKVLRAHACSQDDDSAKEAASGKGRGKGTKKTEPATPRSDAAG